MQPIFSVLIVSYNTRELTLACLRSVIAQTRTPHEILVLDNASTDGSAAAIAAEFPQIALLSERQNHGFARANNFLALKSRGEFLLLLNPDTVVLDGALDRLVAFARRFPGARIWGGHTVFEDGSQQLIDSITIAFYTSLDLIVLKYQNRVSIQLLQISI